MMKRSFALFAIRLRDLPGLHQTALLSTSTSSSFAAPIPPNSKGQAVYNDIDFSASTDPSSNAMKRNQDPNAVHVVTGASRGIGLQFVKSLIDRTEGKIVACCRSPENAHGLHTFLETMSLTDSLDRDRIEVLKLDIEDQTSIDELSNSIRNSYNRVDVLLNVAGLLGDGTSTPGPERSLAKLDRDWIEKSMAVNVIGPVMLSQALSPLMASPQRGKEDKRATTLIANLSARVGSISDNGLGGWYSYRFSKAALNQATRTMSHELKRKGTWTIALHPGTTDTDLSKPFQRNVQAERLFPVEFTVEKLLDVMDSMEEQNSGGLYDWAGKAIPF
uniref:NAD(P)-binding protein n=1 Tax=Attheya septentrionalis TaxID=420275 RepID=A0A7S2UED2_9STRA|mmetsp:Transcript_22019/g.39707  ORF Transcript_22019/g.39707 Transcript_22019/m.39707 type:complete len:332 (+) Transcript_22019:256-1251(+)